MGVLDWLRKKITNSSSSSTTKKLKEANRTSYYGGGVSSKKTQTEVKTSIAAAQKKQKEKQQKTQTQTQAQTQQQQRSSAFKAYDLKTRKIAEAREQREEKPDVFNKKTAFKTAKPSQSPYERQAEASRKAKQNIASAVKRTETPDLKQEAIRTSKERLQKARDTQLAKKNVENIQQRERNRAAEKLKPLFDEKYGGKTKESKLRMKMGEYQSDPLAAEYETLKHPKMVSASRGALNATTLGLSDLAAKRLTKGEAREMEEFYQANKNKTAETAGQLAGSLLMYGGTAGGFEKLGAKAVGRAAETQLGKKLGAEALARTMAGNGAKAALARSLVGDTIQDSTMGLVDTVANVATRDDLKTPKDYMKAIAEGQAFNYGMGLAGNAISHGLPVARRAWGDFADESRRLHIVPPSVADVAEATIKDVDAKPTLKTVISNNLDDRTRKALIAESSDLDNEWWALRENIEREYGSINPNYRELSPEQRADVISKKTRMQEITARRNKISEDLSIVKHVEEPRPSGASVDVPEKEGYNNIKERINGETEIGNAGRAQASGRTVSAVDGEISTRGGADNGVVARVANTSNDAERRGGDGVLRVDSKIRAKLTESGVTDTHLSDVSNNYAAFSNALDAARQSSGFGGYVDPKSVDDLVGKQAKAMLSDDGLAGAVVEKDGNISGVFKNPESKYRGAVYDLIYTARANGGTKMDCFGKELANMYEGCGYSVVGRVKHNPEYVTDPLLKDLQPDVYVLMKNTDDLDTVASKIGKPESAGGYHRSTQEELDKLPLFGKDDYEKALTYRDNLLEKQEAESATKVKSKAKKGKTAKGVESEAKGSKSAGGSRYDDLVAERKRIMDDYFSKNESLDPTARKRIDEINEELKKLEPKKTGKKAKTEASKSETPKMEQSVKSEPLETKTETKAEKASKQAEPPKANTEPKTETKTTKAKTEKKTTKAKTEKKVQATQETFDKDFAEFRKKVGNAKTDLYELENKLRVAETKEDKAAIRKQISALKKDVKTAYNKAGLRYHPDKGGSDDWMAKFNEAYDSFLNGGNGKPPKSQTQKPVRTVKNVEDIVNKSKEKASSKEKVKDAIHSMKRAVSNSMTTFEERNLKSIKADSEGWKVRNAAVDRHRRYNNLAVRSVDKAQLMSNGRRYRGTVERVGADGKTYKIQNGQSLKQIYEGMDKKTEAAFDAYLLLKHAPDRIREGTPIFDRINLDIGNGEPIKSLNDPKVVKAEAERLLKEHPEFAKKAEEIYQYTQNELENRVRAGLLSQETASKWMHDHPFYVPTGRDGYFNVVHGNHKGVIGADSLKAASGSDLDIRSIKEQLAEATSRNWRDITANDLLEKFFGDEVKAGRTASNGLELLNETVGLSKSADGRKFYAKIFRDGDMHRVEIDKNYYQDLADLYKNGRLGDNGGIGTVADTIADATSKFSGTFKKLVTTWNPIFLPKNFSRDFQDALINTRQTKEFAECLAPAWKELKDGGEYARAFEDSGVSQSNFVNLGEVSGKGGKLGKAVDKFIALQDMTESFPRLAEYMATIKKAGYDLDTGLPKKVVDSIKKDFDYDLRKGVKDFKKGTKEIPANVVDAVKKMGYDATAGVDNVPTSVLDIAAANAADVTVNFGRSGSFGKNLNKGLIPFFNPSVQGWSKFLRNFSEQNSVKSTLGVIAKAGMLGAGVVTVNNFLLEDNPNYQQISARDKATNIIIPLAFGKDTTVDNTNLFIKIPRGRFAAVYGLPTVNRFNENDMGWAEMIKIARDQVLPVDPTESSLFAPLYAVSQNKTWYGAPIVPKSLEDLPKSEQYDANTSNIGKALGKATSKLPEEFQISPKKADYILDASTGVVGDFVLPAFTPSRQGGGNAFQKTGHSTLNVLKRAFTIDSVTQNNLSTRFYDKMQKANSASQSSKGTQADKEEYKRYSGYSKEIAKVNKAITALQNGNRKTKQEDIYGLQKVRNQMMQDAIDGKDVPSEYKAMDAVQKYVGTAYAVNHFGSTADKRAMKMYTAKKYGTLSAAEQRKAINADKDFYKGVQSIGKLQAKMEKAGITSDTTLSKAVALASVDASDDMFGAYKAQDQSRTETAHEMKRARTYFKNGGSTDEFVKLEKARKTLGKLPEDERKAELAKLDDEFAKGKMSYAEYDKREADINYNADISYIGLSTSFALANSPERGYRVYDIKDKNIQKGINLAAMGYTARDYRKMSKELDKDGNGYPKKQEIIDYLNKGNFKDKATLYDVLYYYKGKYNPFGTPTKYTRAQAAAEGKKKGVEWITNETDDINVKEEAASGGYYRRWGRWHRWRRHGRSSKSKIKTGSFKPATVHPSKGSSSASKLPNTNVDVSSTTRAGSGARSAGLRSGSGGSGTSVRTTSSGGRRTTANISTNVKSSQSRMSSTPKIDITPLNIKPVKASKSTKGYNSNLSAALKDIEKTQKKVAPPKARRK